MTQGVHEVENNIGHNRSGERGMTTLMATEDMLTLSSTVDSPITF